MLEIYFFRLSVFTNSEEYLEMEPKKRIAIDNEISYMALTVDILFRLFTSKGEKEIPVVAWKLKLDKDDPWIRIHFFSSSKVASLALGVNRNKISQVISGTRSHTGGYVFMHASKYYAQEDCVDFDTSNSDFGFKALAKYKRKHYNE